jgi:hypothetical protein
MTSSSEPDSSEGSLRPARVRRRAAARNRGEQTQDGDSGPVAKPGSAKGEAAAEQAVVASAAAGTSAAARVGIAGQASRPGRARRPSAASPAPFGRLTEAKVNRVWQAAAAAEHHPDRGGARDTMQAINGAWDLLQGRGE